MLHILLIEDNESDVLLIREGIRRCHVPEDVTIAQDGEQGLTLLTGAQFDLVILDLNIPKFSGHAFLQKYRVRDGPPVIVFTGSKNPTDQEIALAFGATDYVVKPQEFLPFMQAVRRMLERSSAACA